MTGKPLQRMLFASGLLLLVCHTEVPGQTRGLGATLILRTQAASVADEAVVRLGSPTTGMEQIAVRVEGGTARSLIENAFLELLTRRGFRTSLVASQEIGRRSLQVTVLDQSVRYTGLLGGEYKREIQTAVEARHSTGDSAGVKYLGLFKRLDSDTVAFREELGTVGLAQEGERSLFDRLLGPVLLIGGAFLVVYLFFTVRN